MSLNGPGYEPPSSARGALLALMGLANYVVFTFVALLGPFFPSFAKSTYGASPVQTGLVFCLYPAAQIAVCPLASVLCRRYGRVAGCYGGLVLLSASTVLFALGTSMPYFMAARMLQGGAGALINVSAIALVMEVSQSLTRDMGIQEVLTGVGYMSGPPLGGLLYSYVGLQQMFLLLSLVPILVLVVLWVSLRLLGVSCGGAPREADAASSSSSLSSTGSGISMVIREPTVVLVALALVADAAALGFMDPTLSAHIFLLLGLDIKSAGFLFAIAPLVYCVGALAVTTVVSLIGNKQTIAAGLLLVSVSFVMLGPIPVLGMLGLRFTVQSVWILLVVCLVGVGLGSALICVPSVPLMLCSLEKKDNKSTSSSGDGEQEKDHLKDLTAAVYIWAWGVGDAIGPLLGGYLEDLLPPTQEVVCTTSTGMGGGCLTSFPWASALYGGAVFLLYVLLAAMVPADSSSGTTTTHGEKARLLEYRRAQHQLQQEAHDVESTIPAHDHHHHHVLLNPMVPGPGSPMLMEAAAVSGVHYYQSFGPPSPLMLAVRRPP